MSPNYGPASLILLSFLLSNEISLLPSLVGVALISYFALVFVTPAYFPAFAFGDTFGDIYSWESGSYYPAMPASF